MSFVNKMVEPKIPTWSEFSSMYCQISGILFEISDGFVKRKLDDSMKNKYLPRADLAAKFLMADGESAFVYFSCRWRKVLSNRRE